MSPPSPAESIFHQESIKQEPLEQSFPLNTLPPAFDTIDSKSSLLSPLDPTQHSAAMLCDLQCRSSRLSSSMTSIPMAWMANLFTYLITMQWQVTCQSIMIALWTLSPSRLARMMAASQARLTSRSKISSMTPLPSRSTLRRLALCNTATGLRAPQGGARVLSRLSFVRDQRSEGEQVTRQPHTDRIDLALRGQVTEDQTMGDDGDEKQGVQELT